MDFHLLALAPAAVGACCTVAERGRARVGDVAVEVLMLIAMIDAVVTRAVPVVMWTALLVVAAVVVAASRGPRSARPHARDPLPTLHLGLGAIVQAALLLLMTGSDLTGERHHHGGMPAGLLHVAVLAAAFAFVVLVGYGLGRRAPALHRARQSAMGLAVLLMAAASV